MNEPHGTIFSTGLYSLKAYSVLKVLFNFDAWRDQGVHAFWSRFTRLNVLAADHAFISGHEEDSVQIADDGQIALEERRVPQHASLRVKNRYEADKVTWRKFENFINRTAQSLASNLSLNNRKYCCYRPSPRLAAWSFDKEKLSFNCPMQIFAHDSSSEKSELIEFDMKTVHLIAAVVSHRFTRAELDRTYGADLTAAVIGSPADPFISTMFRAAKNKLWQTIVELEKFCMKKNVGCRDLSRLDDPGAYWGKNAALATEFHPVCEACRAALATYESTAKMALGAADVRAAV